MALRSVPWNCSARISLRRDVSASCPFESPVWWALVPAIPRRVGVRKSSAPRIPLTNLLFRSPSLLQPGRGVGNTTARATGPAGEQRSSSDGGGSRGTTFRRDPVYPGLRVSSQGPRRLSFDGPPPNKRLRVPDRDH